MSYNYSSKKWLVHSIILAPDNAPDWIYDRQELWNRAEAAETRNNSETARKMTIRLPKELTLEQNIEMLEHFANEFLVSHGMVADVKSISKVLSSAPPWQSPTRRLKYLVNSLQSYHC